LVVARRQLDGEEVGHDRAAAAEQRGPVVHRTAQRRGQLEWLDLGAEGPGEDTVDGALELAFHALEQTHCSAAPFAPSMVVHMDMGPAILSAQSGWSLNPHPLDHPGAAQEMDDPRRSRAPRPR